MKGELYIVATPIGNMGDITLRALEILKSVDFVYCEDTRISKRLFEHYGMSKPLFSYHQHSTEEKRLQILKHLGDGKSIAYICDAGTPGIADPGGELIEYVYLSDPEINIIPVCGASALTAIISVSGINMNKFVFLGFLPKKKRNKLFGWIKEGRINFGFFESPKRILKSLNVIKEYFGSKDVVVGRELTKMHETIYRGKVGDVIKNIEADSTKGEFTVLVNLEK